MIPNANRNPISSRSSVTGVLFSGWGDQLQWAVLVGRPMGSRSCWIWSLRWTIQSGVQGCSVSRFTLSHPLGSRVLHSWWRADPLGKKASSSRLVYPSAAMVSYTSPALSYHYFWSLLLAPVNCLQLSNCLHTVAIDHSLLLLLLTHNNSSSIWTAAQPSSDSLPIIWHTITTFSFSSYGLHSPSCLFTHHN